MLNLKNNKNNAIFNEICKKSEDENKISKNEGHFFEQHRRIPWLKSHQPPLIIIYSALATIK